MNKYVKNKYIYTVSYIKYYIKIIFNHIPGALATPSRLIPRNIELAHAILGSLENLF